MCVQLDETALPALARGCAILGAGGGGDTSVGLLMALQATQDFGPVPLVDLDDLPDDALIMPCGGIGAPTVSIEKIENGSEGARLREHVERLWQRPISALMCGEIGGSNGLVPVVWAARLRLPIVDADGMGRAFPEIPQVTMHVAGISPNPAVMTDERGNVLVFRAISGEWMERLERTAAVEFGGMASSSEYQLTAAQAKTATVRGSVSLAIRIGRVLMDAEDDPVEALAAELRAAVLITGKITDVERRVTGGFVRGSATIEGLGTDGGRVLRLEIQNENLVALEDGRPLAMVPDIITVLDSQTAEAVSTERLRYGQRVSVVAFPCDPIWRTHPGLEVAGPRAFGYDFDYVPVEDLWGAVGGEAR
ncbi:MAG: DUF917 domain-containing protein [Actinobacteria bacterium]|nr:DUF917 domain-containing protein [Actinomycetota bacterium]